MAENGQLTELVAVQGPIQLEPATARAWLAMKAAAARDGVTLEIPAPAGGYRSLAMQRDMHARPESYNLDPRSIVPLAPVGASTHGWGNRVDVSVGTARLWAIDHAAEFGFVREFGSADPGHFHYRGPALAGTPQGADSMPFDAEEKKHLDIVGQSIVDQILGRGAFAGRADSVNALVAKLQRDLNWIHQASPYSLKSIREALAGGADIDITPAQLAELSRQLVAGVSSGLAAALDEDQAAVLAAIRQLPDDVRANLKAAL